MAEIAYKGGSAAAMAGLTGNAGVIVTPQGMRKSPHT
jgi:hypothetical protein